MLFYRITVEPVPARPAQVAPLLKPGQIENFTLMQIFFFASNRVQWEIDLLWNSNEPDHIPDQNPPSRSQNCCQECELLGWSDNNDATDRRVFGWCLLREVLCNSWFFHHLSYGNLHIYALLISHWVHSIFTLWATLMKIDRRRKLGPSSTSWLLMILWWMTNFDQGKHLVVASPCLTVIRAWVDHFYWRVWSVMT